MAYRREALPREDARVARALAKVIQPEEYKAKFPPPGHALQLWFTGEGIRVALPKGDGHEAHTFLLPPDDSRSWTILCSMLRERYRVEQHGEKPTIASRASLTEWQVEGILRAMGRGTAKVDYVTTPEDLGL